nr:hypothetical protein [Mycoplasmopsis cynos]
MKNNMNSQKEPIIILSGPSGVGKGTIERLLFEYEELQLSFSRTLLQLENQEMVN